MAGGADFSEYAEQIQGVNVSKEKNVWDVIREQGIKVDIALPCATQNELTAKTRPPW
jgi:glutamate dehydrogenase (NADP+)